jgi:hypothetical protein
MSDTPETDGQLWINNYPEYYEKAKRYVDIDFARRLERERDEARRLAEAGRDLWSGAQLKTSFPLGKLPWED